MSEGGSVGWCVAVGMPWLQAIRSSLRVRVCMLAILILSCMWWLCEAEASMGSYIEAPTLPAALCCWALSLDRLQWVVGWHNVMGLGVRRRTS